MYAFRSEIHISLSVFSPWTRMSYICLSSSISTNIKRHLKFTHVQKRKLHPPTTSEIYLSLSLWFCSISEFSTCHMSVCSSQVLGTHFIFCFHPCNSHPVTHQVFLVSYSKYKQTRFLKTPVAIGCTQGIHSLLLTHFYSLSAFRYCLTTEWCWRHVCQIVSLVHLELWSWELKRRLSG